jgi:type I restriction-modification system DNA methylase subunit
LTNLAADWRKLLFPEANDKTFADGYAQAVTFGLLMARAKNITLSTGMSKVAAELAQTSSLIGTALRLLTDDPENQETLKTALGTLVRVLDAVDWTKISKGNADAWLYFYEDFLAVYDNDLRKLTGSYYTPPEVVSAMVGLVDEALHTRFNLHAGLASPSVTLADPAIYFWRWATWKVFDHGNGKPGPHDGIVCFITVAGFLSGPGFQKMRAYLG